MQGSDHSASKPIYLLHFSDAHIDIANYGRHDPESALPVRVMDFLHSLDQIVDRAIAEKVDLVLFTGDAYKDRNPQPTFQQAWGQRMMRLSKAGIRTVLLVGNHDVAPAAGRAHTVQEYKTLDVPNIYVADRPALLGPEQLGLPVQIITIPWISRGAVMTREELAGKSHDEVTQLVEEKVSTLVDQLIERADPTVPLVLAAHASVHGARYGSERAVMLGHELVLSRQVVSDKRFDYVALGHIHKHQSLNDDRQPPIVYAGSIERIDFGEAQEQKGFVLANVGRRKTDWLFVPLETRRFIDLKLITDSAESFMDDVMRQLPKAEELDGAICRVQLSYPRDWEPLIDETAIAERLKLALSFHIQKHREFTNRSRLGDTVAVESLGPEALLVQYWQTIGLDEAEATAMQILAKEVLGDVES